VRANSADGNVVELEVLTRIDTAVELEYYRHGGILQYVLRQLLRESANAVAVSGTAAALQA
jgi:aconitate hydratase